MPDCPPAAARRPPDAGGMTTATIILLASLPLSFPILGLLSRRPGH
jgi:hypothetical protein